MYKKFLKIFIALILFYIISLTLVYSINPQVLTYHTKSGLTLINKETNYPRYFFGNSYAVRLDNFTDKFMLNTVIPKKDDDTILEQIMFMNGSHRYWNGYQIILRPLLIPFHYFEIRYINIFIMFGLLIKVMSLISKGINPAASWIFFLAIMCVKFIAVPVSLSFTNMFILMFISIIMSEKFLYDKNPCAFNQQKQNLLIKHIYIFSFILGSITVFFDLLTTPLIPIGMSMLLLYIHYFNKYGYQIPTRNIFLAFIYWSIAYVGTWFTKWILAAVVCSPQIFIEAINKVIFRISGNVDKIEVQRFFVIEKNIKMLFEPMTLNVWTVLMTSVFIILCVLLFRFKKRNINKTFITKILIFAILPYSWYVMAANHSQIHYWFTYRSQIITIFGLMYIFYYVIDWENFRDKLNEFKSYLNSKLRSKFVILLSKVKF